MFCTAFGRAIAITIIIVIVGSLFFFGTNTQYDIRLWTLLLFFSSVFHFRTMMSETQISAAAVVLNTNDYKSPSILLLLRPLIWFQCVCWVLFWTLARALVLVPLVYAYVTVHCARALCQYMKHANRKWFANLWSFRLKTNNPFFIRIQNTRPNRCYCER